MVQKAALIGSFHALAVLRTFKMMFIWIIVFAVPAVVITATTLVPNTRYLLYIDFGKTLLYDHWDTATNGALPTIRNLDHVVLTLKNPRCTSEDPGLLAARIQRIALTKERDTFISSQHSQLFWLTLGWMASFLNVWLAILIGHLLLRLIGWIKREPTWLLKSV